MRHSINWYLKENKSGFTLIEILVVVAIIGILVSFVTLNFNDARKKSRDQARKSDLQALQLAIETYKVQYNVYPEAGCGAPANNFAGPGTYGSNVVTTCDTYIVGVVPDFIKTLPTDPNLEQAFDKGYLYRTNGDHSAYKLVVHESVESEVVVAGNEFARYASTCGVATPSAQYAVYSLGAECW